MKSKPIISYVIPCYNCEITIVEAILSIRDTHETIMREKNLPSYWHRMEIICVNDCSEDNTGMVLEAMSKQHENVTTVHLAENMGKGYCRNLGNGLAGADIIAVLDSDDWAVADRTATILKTFKNNPDRDIFYSGFMTVHVELGQQVPFKAEKINKHRLKTHGEFGICHSTVAYRKSAILKLPYSNDRNQDDWNMLWNFYTNGYKFCYSTKILVAYRADLKTLHKESKPGKQDGILEKKKKVMEPYFAKAI